MSCSSCPPPAKEKQTTSIQLSHIKAAVFCGVKGYFTFELAFISYINYSFHCFLLKQKNKDLVQEYNLLRKSAAFAMKRNLIPFCEIIVMPLICLGLSKIPGVNSVLKDHLYLYNILICVALMIAACFVVRTFHLREKLVHWWYTEKECNSDQIKEKYTLGQIEESFKQDDICYPIYSKANNNLMFNFPDGSNDSGNGHNKPPGQMSNFALLVILGIITLPLKLLQATTMLSLSIVELGEAVFNFPFDLLTYNSKNKFVATKSNLQRSGHLFYGFIRDVINIICFPITIPLNCYYQVYKESSPFSSVDEAVAQLIGKPKSTCCGANG